MEKVNSNNILSKYIKNLISTSYIVTAPIWKKGKPIDKDRVYITNDYIVKAIDSCNDTSNNRFDFNSHFQILSPFVENKYYPSLTSKYMSSTGVYDSLTHYHLGQLLRQVRDLHGIDLMQYYNCYDGSSTDKYRIKLETITENDTETGNNTEKNILTLKDFTLSGSDNYKLIAVPVKFNEKYTVYIDSQLPIKYGFAYYDNVNALYTTDKCILVNGGISNVSFSNPLVISSPTADAMWERYSVAVANNKVYLEQYLTLFIEIPLSKSDSIIVLEGDYSKNKLVPVINSNGQVINNSEVTLSKYYQGNEKVADSKLYNRSANSLVQLSRNETYAFTDRLIEYLALNVISHQDPIYRNIINAQKDTSTRKCKASNGLNYEYPNYGTYDDKYREFIYRLATTNSKLPLLYDIDGFIDKDTEDAVIRGKDRDDKKWGEE